MHTVWICFNPILEMHHLFICVKGPLTYPSIFGDLFIDTKLAQEFLAVCNTTAIWRASASSSYTA